MHPFYHIYSTWVREPELSGDVCYVFALHGHLVFVSKYRRLVFTKEIWEDLRAIFSDVGQDFEAT